MSDDEFEFLGLDKKELLKSTLLDEAPFLINKLQHLIQRSVFYP